MSHYQFDKINFTHTPTNRYTDLTDPLCQFCDLMGKKIKMLRM